MHRVRRVWQSSVESLGFAYQALRFWGLRQITAAVIATIAVGFIVGIATVLIPNPVFGRDIEPVAWNYPVWIITSILTGLLIATYVRPSKDAPDDIDSTGTKAGGLGAILAWFAVGCPVCNKIALLVLGYSGALTWFAPLQPVLAVLAVVLVFGALVWRLRGQVACPMPTPKSVSVA